MPTKGMTEMAEMDEVEVDGNGVIAGPPVKLHRGVKKAAELLEEVQDVVVSRVEARMRSGSRASAALKEQTATRVLSNDGFWVDVTVTITVAAQLAKE